MTQLLYMEAVCGTMMCTPLGAQTVRRGGAGPAGGLLGGKDPTGRFVLFCLVVKPTPSMPSSTVLLNTISPRAHGSSGAGQSLRWETGYLLVSGIWT
jgi:hypothetical protein